MSSKKQNKTLLTEKYIPIVLCAGFGTRLRPITNYIPKVICPIIDKPLAFFSIEKFFDAGFENVYCNTHYLPDLVELELKACAKDLGYDSNRIIFFNEPEILGSGGGILNIVTQLTKQNQENKYKDVIVVSGDIVADIPLDHMLLAWENKTSHDFALMLSLPLQEDRDDLMCVSQDGRNVIGFGKKFPNSCTEKKYIRRLFSNHQIIASDIIHSSEQKTGSSVDLFYNKILLQNNKTILHFNFPESSFWFNVGDITEYHKCLKYFLAEKKFPLDTKNYMHLNYSEFDENLKHLLNLK